MPRSRRKKVVTTKTGLKISEAYCRRCMKTLPSSNFYAAVDLDLDKNGLFSLCRGCVGEMFELTLSSEHSIEKTILKLCRKLNLKYSLEAIAATMTHMETFKANGRDEPPFMGIYISKLHVVDRTGQDIGSVGDLTYQEVTKITIGKETVDDNAFNGAGKDLKAFWGNGLDEADYTWLQNEYNDWSKRHDIKTKSQEELLKMIVLKSFDIRKEREQDRDASALEKNFRELLKTSGLSPLDMNAAGGGKNKDCFGVWLKDISEKRPEEWVENQDKYRDVDDVEEYNERNIKSPLRALVTGNREFTIDGDEIISEDEE